MKEIEERIENKTKDLQTFQESGVCSGYYREPREHRRGNTVSAGARIGAYELQEDGSLVARYTAVQEAELGLTHRDKVGPKWTEAQDTIVSDAIESNNYSRKLQNYLGVKNQVALSMMMEDEFSAGGDE